MNEQTFQLFDLVRDGTSMGKLKKFIHRQLHLPQPHQKHKQQNVKDSRKSFSNNFKVDWNARNARLGGKTVLHVACQMNNIECVQVLLELVPAIDPLSTDIESQMTPLAQALYCGNVRLAVRMMELRPQVQWGQPVDADGQTAFECLPFVIDTFHLPPIVTSPGSPIAEDQSSSGALLYTWGSNVNFNLGHADARDRQQPDQISYRLSDAEEGPISISRVYMSKYHTTLVTSRSDVYVCGQANSGRLGISLQSEESTAQFSFRRVTLPRGMYNMALSSYHSLFLRSDGDLYSCGLNDFGQLGHDPATMGVSDQGHVLTELKRVQRIHSLRKVRIRDVAASRIHSVAFSDQELYTWGLNNGQLGYERGNAVESLPRRVPMHNQSAIEAVAANEHSTLVLCKGSYLYLLINYSWVKINNCFPLPFGVQNSLKFRSIAADRFRYSIIDSKGRLFILHLVVSSDQPVGAGDQVVKFYGQYVQPLQKVPGKITQIAFSGPDSPLLVLTSLGKVYYGHPTNRTRRLSSFDRRNLEGPINSPPTPSSGRSKMDQFYVGREFPNSLKMNFVSIPSLKFIKYVAAGASGTFAAIKYDFILETAESSYSPQIVSKVETGDDKNFADGMDELLIKCSDGVINASMALMIEHSRFVEAAIEVKLIQYGTESSESSLIDLSHYTCHLVNSVIEGCFDLEKWRNLVKTDCQDLESVCEVLEIVDELLIDSLRIVCESRLIEMITYLSAPKIAEIAEYFTCDNVFDRLITFVGHHLEIYMHQYAQQLAQQGRGGCWKFSDRFTVALEEFVKKRIKATFPFSRNEYIEHINGKILQTELSIKEKLKQGLESITASVQSIESMRTVRVSTSTADDLSDNEESASPDLQEENQRAFEEEDEMVFVMDPDQPQPPVTRSDAEESRNVTNGKMKAVWQQLPQSVDKLSLSDVVRTSKEVKSSSRLNTPTRKLSQKQRKLKQQQISFSPATTSISGSPSTPWKKTWTAPVESSIKQSQSDLTHIMKQELLQQQEQRKEAKLKKQHITSIKNPTISSSPISPSFDNVIRSPTQPWRAIATLEVISDSSSSPSQGSTSRNNSNCKSLKEIQGQQRRQSEMLENALKGRRKSLKQIQIEENAISELKAWYERNADPVKCEYFEVKLITRVK